VFVVAIGLAFGIPTAFVAPALAQTVTATWVDNANGQMFDVNGSGTPGGTYMWPDNRLWTQQERFDEVADVTVMIEPSNWSTPRYPNNGNGGVNYQVIIPATNDPAVGGPPQWPLLQGLQVTVNMMTVQQFGRLQMRATGSTSSLNSLRIVAGDLLNGGVIDIANNPADADLIFAYNSQISGGGQISLLDTTGNSDPSVRVEPGFTVTMVDGHSIRGDGEIVAGDATLGGGFVNNGDIVGFSEGNNNTPSMRIHGSGIVNNKRIAATPNASTAPYLFLFDLTMSQGSAGAVTAESAPVRFERSTISGGTVTGSGGGTIELRSGRTTLKSGATLVHTAGMGATQMYSGEGLALDNGGTYDFTGDNSVVASGSGGGDRSINVLAGGVLRKSGGTGQSVINTPVNLTGGTISATSGTLVLAGGGISAGGTFTTGSGATVNIAGGSTHLYTGTYTGSGAGSVSFAGGTIQADKQNVTLNFSGNTFKWSGGQFDTGGVGSSFTNVGVMNIVNGPNDDATLRALLANQGTVTYARDAFGLRVVSGGDIDNYGLWNFTSDGLLDFISGGGTKSFDNFAGGTLRKSAGAGTSTVDLDFSNTGVVDVQIGTLAFTRNVAQTTGTTLTGGTWKVGAGAALVLDGGNLATNQGSVVLSGSGSTFAQINSLANNQGSFDINSGRNFSTVGNLTNSGLVTIGPTSTLTVDGMFTQTATGKLKGKGKLITTKLKSSGTVSPGSSPGILEVEGDYEQDATGVLEIEIGGNVAGSEFDLLSVTGSATIAGTLQLVIVNAGGGFSLPSIGNPVAFLTATGGVSGAFQNAGNLRAVAGGSLVSWSLTPSGNGLSVAATSITPLADGDYDGNGFVDGADYVVWRKLAGGIDLAADGNRDGVIDGLDYNVWRSHFGTSGPASATMTSIPEPTSVLALVVAVLLIVRRRSHN
jgi:hypothetical protein